MSGLVSLRIAASSISETGLSISVHDGMKKLKDV